MMNLEILVGYCKNKIEQYPVLRGDIEDLCYLAHDEVEQGNSEVHEVRLALSDIEQLIEDYLQRIKELELELKQLKGEL